MAVPNNLPITETLGIFVGITGFDWLTEGKAEPLEAIISAILAGLVIFTARCIARQRRKN